MEEFMNYELIIDDLNNWDTAELFYRDYYMTVQSEGSVESLLQRTDIPDFEKKIVQAPTSVETDITEEQFFANNQNVSIVKHPRYMPFFMHRHAFFEIIYVLSGHCQEITHDLVTDLHTGDICLLAPGISHGIKVFDDSLVLDILIRHSTFSNIFLNSIRTKSQISLFFTGNIFELSKTRYLLYKTSEDTAIRNYILDMYIEQLHFDRYSDQIICALMTIFLTQLTRKYEKNVIVSNQIGCKTEYSDKIIKYIMEHYESVTLNELAEHFHFSVPYCSKVVKAVSGKSFSELITQIRLSQSQNLLDYTEMSIVNISEAVGYKNPESFIRAFQRVYNISPSKYRKRLVKND